MLDGSQIDGIEVIEADTFRLSSKQTFSGIKIVLVSLPIAAGH